MRGWLTEAKASLERAPKPLVTTPTTRAILLLAAVLNKAQFVIGGFKTEFGACSFRVLIFGSDDKIPAATSRVHFVWGSADSTTTWGISVPLAWNTVPIEGGDGAMDRPEGYRKKLRNLHRGENNQRIRAKGFKA